jgi:hypothetical protein
MSLVWSISRRVHPALSSDLRASPIYGLPSRFLWISHPPLSQPEHMLSQHILPIPTHPHHPLISLHRLPQRTINRIHRPRPIRRHILNMKEHMHHKRRIHLNRNHSNLRDMLPPQLRVMLHKKVRYRGSNRAAHQRLALVGIRVKYRTRPLLQPLARVPIRYRKEPYGFGVDDVVGAVDLNVAHVAVPATPVAPVDVGEGAEGGEFGPGGPAAPFL